MTVAELITALQALPQDLDIATGPAGEEYDAQEIELVDEIRTAHIGAPAGHPGTPIRVRFVRIG